MMFKLGKTPMPHLNALSLLTLVQLRVLLIGFTTGNQLTGMPRLVLLWSTITLYCWKGLRGPSPVIIHVQLRILMALEFRMIRFSLMLFVSISDHCIWTTCDDWQRCPTDPPEVKLALGPGIEPDNIRETSDVYMECLVHSNPQLSSPISWYWEGRQLTTDPSTGVIISNSTLLLQKVRRGLSGRYSCSGRNTLGVSTSTQDFYLRVLYPPKVSIVLGHKIDASNIRESTDVYFECLVESDPWVTEVSWFFEGRQLFTLPSAGVIISNHSLVLQRVKRTSRGRYWCQARNSLGVGSSDDFFLKVLCE